MSIAPFRRAWAFALFFTLWMSVAGESLAQSTLGPNARRVLEYWGSHEDPAYVRDATPVLLRCEGEIGGYFGSQSQNSNPASVPHAPATFLNDAVLALRDARSGNFEPIERHLDKAESDHQSSGGHIATQMRLCFHRQVKASLSGAAPSASQSAIRPSAPVAASPSPVSDAARADAMAAFRAEWRAFRERHPIVRTWTEAEISQYQLFMGTNSLAILNRHKTNMAKEDYDAIAKPGIEMRDQGRARCPACKVEYPVKQSVAGLDTPSVSFQTQYRAAQDLYVSHEENERTRRRMADDASGASNGLFGALANIGKPSLIHNRANDATACIRVEPTGAQMEWGIEGRYRCATAAPTRSARLGAPTPTNVEAIAAICGRSHRARTGRSISPMSLTPISRSAPAKRAMPGSRRWANKASSEPGSTRGATRPRQRRASRC